MLSTAFLTNEFGTLEISASPVGLCGLRFVEKPEDPSMLPPPHMAIYVDQLCEYFSGQRKRFDLPIDWSGLPSFHRQVLQMVYTIPYGKVRTYQQIAEVIGKPGAARAVGQANGKNPMVIVIPCHRVIGKSGNLTGYAYGLDIKRKLLALETPRCYAPQTSLFAANAG